MGQPINWELSKTMVTAQTYHWPQAGQLFKVVVHFVKGVPLAPWLDTYIDSVSIENLVQFQNQHLLSPGNKSRGYFLVLTWLFSSVDRATEHTFKFSSNCHRQSTTFKPPAIKNFLAKDLVPKTMSIAPRVPKSESANSSPLKRFH